MVLRITISNADILREAVRAVPIPGTTLVLLIWTPQFFAVQSMHPEKLGRGQNPTTLLKIASESFISYESTDNYFNALVQVADLNSAFSTANNSDPIEFSQSLEDDNGLNDLGFLRVRFGRPIDCMDEYVSLKIHGMLPEKMLQSADVSYDPSVNPLFPVAIFRAKEFVQFMTQMGLLGIAVKVTVLENEVFFVAGEQIFEPIIMTPEKGLISVRGDVEILKSIRLDLNTQNVDIQAAPKLSNTVSMYKRTDEVVLIWFTLSRTRTLLKGDLIYYFY